MNLGTIEIRRASTDDLGALEQVGDALFDHPIRPDRAVEFLNDPRHHLFLALDGRNVVGMASGFHYVHPDKEPALFINEVGVLEAYQGQGIGKTLVRAIWSYAKKIGCKEAWVGTESSNTIAQKCYKGAGGVADEDPFILFEFVD